MRTVETWAGCLLGLHTIVNHELVVDEDLGATDERDAELEGARLVRRDETLELRVEELFDA